MKMNSVLLIPSLNPPKESLDRMCQMKRFFRDVVVVNDGSSKCYDRFFSALSRNGLVVRYHHTNRGKGDALKTGFSYIKEHFPGRDVVTADSDGQHTIKDILAVSEKLRFLGEKSIVLGKRNIVGSNAPIASKGGNSLTSFFIEALFKRNIVDTQSGLRGIGNKLIGIAMEIDGNRYEYETAFLLYCLKERINIEQIPIETVYENNNKGSHFHKLRDSYLIYKTIFKEYLKIQSPFHSMPKKGPQKVI